MSHNHHPILPEEEITALVLLYQSERDEEAAARIIAHNENLVHSIAVRYYSSGVTGDAEMEDLMQWGRIGLLRAMQDFVPGTVKFSSYAWHWVRSYIARNGLQEGSKVSMSHRAREHRGKVGQVRAKFEQDNQREPTRQELAVLTGYKEKYLDDLRVYTISIDAQDNNDKARSMLNTMADPSVNVEDEACENADSFFNKRLRGYIDALPEGWRKVIIIRHGLDSGTPMGLRQTGDALGISAERVRQIEGQAVRELRKSLGIV